MRSADPLSFFDLRPYRERLAEAELNTGLTDAMIVGGATLDDHPLELAVMDFAFMGGSMGAPSARSSSGHAMPRSPARCRSLL